MCFGVHLDSSLQIFHELHWQVNLHGSLGLCTVLAWLAESPLWRAAGPPQWGLFAVCNLREQLPPFFLYPFSGKGKRGDVCVCFRWGECSPDRLFSGLKWMGERSSMGREVEAASAPLFVSTASVLNIEFVEWEASRSWEMQFKRSYVSA